MFYRRTDRANSTRIGVHSPLAMLAGGSLLVMSVTLNISTPSLAASSYSSAHVEAHESWPSDWADSSFCSTIGVRYMGNSFDGVAACGDQYRNSSSNTQGEISYKGVEFDSVGFQCVELAARYFYATTGRTPPRANGSLYARDVTNVDPQLNLSPSTDIYQSTLKTGDIISMGPTNTYGHVAIVISVEPSVLSGGNGTISVLNENAYTTGIDKITVTNGAMTYEGLYNIFQWAFGIPTPDFNGPTPPAPAPPPSAPVGPFAYRIVLPGTGPNATVNERAGAGTSFVIVGRLPEASIIEISCQTSGTLVNTSTVWDQLSNGDYVSDYFTNTPAKNGFSSNIPRCASGSTTTTTPPPTMTVTSPNFSVGPDSACLVTTSGMV